MRVLHWGLLMFPKRCPCASCPCIHVPGHPAPRSVGHLLLVEPAEMQENALFECREFYVKPNFFMGLLKYLKNK